MPGQRSEREPALNDDVLDGLRSSLGPAANRVLAQLFRLFLKDVGPAMIDIRSAAEARDAGGLARSAHRLRGDAATIGASPLENLCAEAELLGRAGNLTAAGGLVDLIADELGQVEMALRERQAAA
ncbi:MAG: Hpt domain-containing protein [Actinomycetota bacterium]